MLISNFLQTTQAFPLKFKDPPLKLSSRWSWVERTENYVEILKGMVVLKWHLTIYLFRALNTHDYGKLLGKSRTSLRFT